MSNETDHFELKPHDVDHILATWQDESYLKHLSDREAAHESNEITDRMFEESDKLAAQRAAETPRPDPIVFEIPATAQKKLEANAQDFSDDYDRLDGQGQFTSAQIRESLAKGLKTPEEIEAEEIRRISAHASKVHKPRVSKPTTLKRQLGPTQREIADSDKRVEAAYGKPDDS